VQAKTEAATHKMIEDEIDEEIRHFSSKMEEEDSYSDDEFNLVITESERDRLEAL